MSKTNSWFFPFILAERDLRWWQQQAFMCSSCKRRNYLLFLSLQLIFSMSETVGSFNLYPEFNHFSISELPSPLPEPALTIFCTWITEVASNRSSWIYLCPQQSVLNRKIRLFLYNISQILLLGVKVKVLTMANKGLHDLRTTLSACLHPHQLCDLKFYLSVPCFSCSSSPLMFQEPCR